MREAFFVLRKEEMRICRTGKPLRLTNAWTQHPSAFRSGRAKHCLPSKGDFDREPNPPSKGDDLQSVQQANQGDVTGL